MVSSFTGDERVAGLGTVEPAKGNCVAGLRLAALGRLLAQQGEKSRDALIVGGALDRDAVGEGAGEHAGERQLAAVRGVEGLEDVGARRRAVDFKALSCVADKRGFVPQRLQQPEDAVAGLGRAHQHRADQALAQLLGQIVEHLVARRRHVL
jgi:hypothetical protein